MKVNNLYLLLGTNLGERNQNLKNALAKIEEKIGVITSLSSIYETAAWGKTDQPNFLNQAICVKTSLKPLEVLAQTQKIENVLGRTKTEHWGERIIDIDILYFADKIFETENLQIPHPFIQSRRFTLIPLTEIAAEFIHPKLKKTNAKLLEICEDFGEVWQFFS